MRGRCRLLHPDASGILQSSCLGEVGAEFQDSPGLKMLAVVALMKPCWGAGRPIMTGDGLPTLAQSAFTIFDVRFWRTPIIVASSPKGGQIGRVQEVCALNQLKLTSGW